MKYIEPKEKVVQQLPSKEILQNYGRSSKLLITAKDIPNLQFNVEKTEENNDFQEHSQTPLEGAEEVMEILETEVLPHNVSKSSTNSQYDSENHND